MGQLTRNEVFTLAVQRYSDTVYRTAVHNCRCTADAEDVVQDVFEKLLHYNGIFESEEHLKAWLLRVAINRCRDLTRAAHQKDTELDENLPAPDALEEDGSVLDAIRTLPENYRNAIYLHYYEGYTAAEIGGVLRYGIPEFRLPKTVLDDFEYRHLRLKGIKVRPNTDVGKALKIEDLFRDGYKAIFIGTGVWRPNTLHIKGESLGNVHYAINYLQNPDVYHLGSRVIVIGAGNAAMDVARTAIRHGTRHLECFSLSSHITASEYEASYAKLEGVNFIFNKKPLEITDKGVVFIDLNEAEDGTLTEIPGTEKLYPADSVIVSISQGPCTTITDSTKNLKTTPRGLFETDEVGRTSIPGIFASGDAVKGARTVVEAVAYSKNVAEAMHEYMQTLPPDLPDEYANVPVAEYDEGN